MVEDEVNVEGCTHPLTSLEKEINHVLISGKINYQDRIWFLRFSLWDKCLTKEEQEGISEIFHRARKWSDKGS